MIDVTATIVSVNIGRVQIVDGSLLGRTGIHNAAVAGRVRAEAAGLAGDEVADSKHHGGVDQAVYAYQREDLDRWAAELGRELPAGFFGENLTTSGIDLAAVVIGERWRVGDVEFEVSCPRTPCGTFQNHMGAARWVKRFTVEGRTGAYLRVLTPGTVGAGDGIVVLSTPEHTVTNGEVFRAITTERDRLPGLLAAPQLPCWMHEMAQEYVAERSA